MSELEEVRNLLKVCDQLLGPSGCPWDREQTMQSVRKYVLEETCELIEAIDLGDNQHIQEELGDLFFNAVFLCRLAEKEQRTSFVNVVKEVTQKLIRRHPHVFSNEIAATTEEVLHRWEAIKKVEKGAESRKSLLDGIPKDLPALSRASKIAGRLTKHNYPLNCIDRTSEQPQDEEALGASLWSIVCEAQKNGLDPEHALRKFLALKEKEVRDSEAREAL